MSSTKQRNTTSTQGTLLHNCTPAGGAGPVIMVFACLAAVTFFANFFKVFDTPQMQLYALIFAGVSCSVLWIIALLWWRERNSLLATQRANASFYTVAERKSSVYIDARANDSVNYGASDDAELGKCANQQLAFQVKAIGINDNWCVVSFDADRTVQDMRWVDTDYEISDANAAINRFQQFLNGKAKLHGSGKNKDGAVDPKIAKEVIEFLKDPIVQPEVAKSHGGFLKVRIPNIWKPWKTETDLELVDDHEKVTFKGTRDVDGVMHPADLPSAKV